MEVRFATSNPHKVLEGNLVGKRFGMEFVQIRHSYPEIRDEDVSRVAEDGARFVFDKINEPVIVEDTGLFIERLNGFPGSFSAFVFQKIGNEGILRLLENEGNRNAEFISAIGYCDGKGVNVFRGSVGGTIADDKRGTDGFGYDPIFVPEGYKKTFAEDPEMKAMVSHRRNAFQSFCEWITRN
jgi:XTP/dITP diphosphohydrolase